MTPYRCRACHERITDRAELAIRQGWAWHVKCMGETK